MVAKNVDTSRASYLFDHGNVLAAQRPGSAAALLSASARTRGLGRTLIQLRKLPCKTAPILINSGRQLPAELVEYIDQASKALLELRIGGVERFLYTPVVLLARGLQLAELSPARQTMLRKRVNPESVLFVPDPLFGCAECKFPIAALAREDRVHVPIPRADGAILPFRVCPDGATVVDP